MAAEATIRSINAVTLSVADMDRSVSFYESLGFEIAYGGGQSEFTSFGFGGQALNLIQVEETGFGAWGRVIIYVEDVDAMHARVVAAGHSPEAAPRDAPWNERFFHLDDPDGHQLSFARPL